MLCRSVRSILLLHESLCFIADQAEEHQTVTAVEMRAYAWETVYRERISGNIMKLLLTFRCVKAVLTVDKISLTYLCYVQYIGPAPVSHPRVISGCDICIVHHLGAIQQIILTLSYLHSGL